LVSCLWVGRELSLHVNAQQSALALQMQLWGALATHVTTEVTAK